MMIVNFKTSICLISFCWKFTLLMETEPYKLMGTCISVWPQGVLSPLVCYKGSKRSEWIEEFSLWPAHYFKLRTFYLFYYFNWYWCHPKCDVLEIIFSSVYRISLTVDAVTHHTTRYISKTCSSWTCPASSGPFVKITNLSYYGLQWY